MKKGFFIILIIGIALIAFAGGLYSGKKLSQSKIDEIQKILDYYFPPIKDLYYATGKITAIEGNLISLEIISPSERFTLPDQEPQKEIRKVTITDATKIVKREIAPPGSKEPIIEIELDLTDLKTGDRISAEAEENIIDKTEFEAKYIELIFEPGIEEMPVE